MDVWPPAGRRLLFGDRSISIRPDKSVEVEGIEDPVAEARRLLTKFVEQAYRRPITPTDVERFVKVANGVYGDGFWMAALPV